MNRGEGQEGAPVKGFLKFVKKYKYSRDWKDTYGRAINMARVCIISLLNDITLQTVGEITTRVRNVVADNSKMLGVRRMVFFTSFTFFSMHLKIPKNR